MANKVLKLLGIFLIIILISISGIFVYRNLAQSKIKHYKQFVLPCEGRIASYEGTDAVLTFYVLDEESISEMADSKNIKAIRLISDNDICINAKSWKITNDANFYGGVKYSAKKLSVTITNTESICVSSMEIDYPDTTEVFDIGQLNIYSQAGSNPESFTQIFPLTMDADPYKGLINDTVEEIFWQETLLEITANSMSDNITIDSIDFGIPGMGIDPSTLKEINESINIQQEITNQNPDYDKYKISDVIDKLPEQKVNIPIKGGDSPRTFVMGLRITSDYADKLMVRYISPIFYCTDLQTGEQYTYVNMNYMMDSTHIFSDEYAKKLLEENGQ